VLRHTALFLLRDSTTESARKDMLRGLERLFEECPTVLGGDFGESLPPREEPSYDVALHLDFADADGYLAYVSHPTHVAVSSFNATLAVHRRTARVDWRYDGPLRWGPGRVRLCAAYVWAPGATEAARRAALSAVDRLADQPGVISAVAALDEGGDPRASDWILDLELTDESSARALLNGDAYRSATAALAPAIEPRRTALVMHAGRG